LKGVSGSTLDVLAKRIWRLPADRARVSIDLGIALGAVSLRAALELLRAAPDVAPLLSVDDLRTWGEVGGRLASLNPDVAIEFFDGSAGVLEALPDAKRGLVLQFVARQAVLSNRTAVESFRFAPELVARVDDPRVASEVLAICLELARHSVKHSGELLRAAPDVVAHLREIDPSSALTHRAVALASAFAHRSGGTAADFFASIPKVVRRRDLPALARLFDETEIYLDRSGSVALQFFVAGGVVLQIAGTAVFDEWNVLCRRVALQSNAATYHFLKFSPSVIAELARRDQSPGGPLVSDVLAVVNKLGEASPAAAIECFRAAPRALATASIQQFRQWAFEGLEAADSSPRRLQAYYALESRGSREALEATEGGLTLDSVSHTLRLYVEGLTGRELTVSSIDEVPEESSIGDGNTIYLPNVVSEFADADDNFRLFKVLAAHGAGQIEFGTYDRSTDALRAAFADVSTRLLPKGRRQVRLRADFGYSEVLQLFPDPALARRVFTTLENGRIDARLRAAYRGIRRDLDFVYARLFAVRPAIEQLPPQLALHELLLQAAVGGGVRDEARQFYGKLAGDIEDVVEHYLRREGAGVHDTLVATAVVYENLLALDADAAAANERSNGAPGEGEGAEGDPSETEADPQSTRAAQPQLSSTRQVAHWSQTSNDPAESDMETFASSPAVEAPEQDLEAGDVAYPYDEWDRELGDHRIDWCRIIERRGARGSRSFVELVRSRYAGVISSIRYQFQLMRPENLLRIRGEVDGEEYDLQKVIDYAIDRRATGRVDERLYVRKLRRERDVAVSFLLDMSSSTARTISRYPNQPYSHPGRRIIDIEKEGLVLMSEALEAVGDLYAMHGFTSEGRRNVKFYVIKDYAEPYSAEVEKRIGGISYQNNTRLGTAIRHAAAKLQRQQARTKLLVVLSDGRPYDHDYGDSRYAREDTKMALRHAKRSGITPFCITIDRESEDQLREMYGEVGYTIIDDVLSLPERMPAIYRRLTT
jgi:hypothetical protein